LYYLEEERRYTQMRFLIICGSLAITFLFVVIIVMTQFTYRVDAGKVGLLINYTATKQADGRPKFTVLPQSSFNWYNSWGGEAVFEYPVSLQTLSMVAAANEGQQTGDDSVAFSTLNGIQLKMDVTVQWRVTNPAQLYFLMPGIPLDGDFNHDVSTKLVRQSVIHALNQSGSTYTWSDVASHENDIEKSMGAQLYQIMDTYGIQIEQISLGQPHYSDDQSRTISALARAQQESQQAQFLKQKAEYEAAAAAIQAQSQAQQIGIIEGQLAKSPDYLQYLLIQMYKEKWDGHLPQTMAGSDKNMILTPFH
jgi:regulator of protease activity HflC (stomatin/prohibitin superfamily)